MRRLCGWWVAVALPAAAWAQAGDVIREVVGAPPRAAGPMFAPAGPAPAVELLPRPAAPGKPAALDPARKDRHGDPLPLGAVARFGSARLRHGGHLELMAFTADSKTLVTASFTDGTVRAWEPTTGRELRRLDAALTHLIPLSTGGVLVVEDTRARVWSPTSGDTRTLPEGMFPEPHAPIAAHPDGRSFAACVDGRVVIKETATGKNVYDLKLPRDKVCLWLTFSPDGRWLAGGGGSGVCLWDVPARKRVRTYPAGAGGGAAWFSPDGRTVAIPDEELKLFPTDSDEERDGFRTTESAFVDVRFPADGKGLFALHPDGTAVRFDADTGEEKSRVPPPADGLNQAVLSPDTRTAAAVDATGAVRVWNPHTGKGPALDRLPPLSGVWLPPDGKTAVCLDSDGRSHAWELATGKPVRTDEPALPDGQIVRWNPAGGRLAVMTGGQSAAVEVADAKTGEVVRKVPLGEGGSSAVAFCPADRDRLAVAVPGTLSVVNLATGKTARTIATPAGDVYATDYSPDGRLVAVAGQTLTVWEVATGRRRFEAAAVRESPAVTFSPDGRLLAAWDGEGRVALFDLRAGAIARRLAATDGGGAVLAGAFSPDGALFAAGNPDGGVRLFDTRTGVLTRTLERHDGAVTALAFTRDGTRLVSAGADGTALVWDLSAPAPAAAPAGLAVAGADEAFALLADRDAGKAARGMDYFYAHPNEAAAAFAEKVPVPAAVPAADVARAVSDLGSDDYKTRQTAAKALSRAGGQAAAALAAAAASPSAEVRKAAEGLLAQLDADLSRPDDLRAARAVEVLEGLATPAARGVLARWAAGPPGHRLTTEAAAAAARLDGRAGK